MLQMFLITVAMIGFAFAIIGVKMFIQKGGMFTKTCSTVDNTTGQKIGCICDENDKSSCVNYELHHGALKGKERD